VSRGRWLARSAGFWALLRLFGARRAPRFAPGQERPAGPPGRTVVARGHEFFLREAGPEGAPRVLLLHGWAFDSLTAWHRLIPLLAGDVRVLAVDLRGHGKTDRIRQRFSVEDLADDVAAVLDALGPGRYTVVGYSLGGLVAQALARRHPARVERLVLAATATRLRRGPHAVAAALVALQRALARLGGNFVPWAMYRYLLRSGAVPAQHAAWLWEVLAARDNDLHHEAGLALARFDSASWVGSLRLPVLCLVPARDQLVPPSRQRATAALIPGAAVVEIAGARHEALFTHAPGLAAAILDFLGAPAALPGAGG
jgi:3-oxoadipate enol-lactonase